MFLLLLFHPSVTTWSPLSPWRCCCSWSWAMSPFRKAESPTLCWWWWTTWVLVTWVATATRHWGKLSYCKISEEKPSEPCLWCRSARFILFLILIFQDPQHRPAGRGRSQAHPPHRCSEPLHPEQGGIPHRTIPDPIRPVQTRQHKNLPCRRHPQKQCHIKQMLFLPPAGNTFI